MESSHRWAIIYCPKQGVRRTHKHWEHIKELLDVRHVQYDFVQSESRDSVERLSKMLIANGYETLIIVGGDSALNRALNALNSFDADVRSRVVFGIIPNGRGNDFASFWNFTEDNDEKAIDALISRRIHKIDVGLLSYADTKTDTPYHIYFFNCVNIGLVSNIMNLKYKTYRIFGLSALSYFASMFLLLFQRMESKMCFQINEERVERKIMSVCVGNCRGYGQTPNAVPYNGMLDVSVISAPKTTQLFKGMWLLFTRKFLNHRDVKAYRTQRTIRFDEVRNGHISVDGMVLEGISAPFEISILPEHVNFIINS